jgi:hydrogenase expression/formation protein HypE
MFSDSCPAPITDREHVQLGHGSGGRLTAELIEHEIVPALANPMLSRLDDQALLPAPPRGAALAFTTDSYVVTPLFFPGGDIGELAVNGTINDLAVGGARPLALSLSFILEEGLPMATLRRVLLSIKRAAIRAEVPVVTGDTKVVPRGSADKIFINTSGIGYVDRHLDLGAHRVQEGDVVLVSGTLADHGMTIMATRDGMTIDGLRSDTAPLSGLCSALLAVCPAVHAMRDSTRGGVAAVVTEIARRRKLGIELDERALPMHDPVRGACELLGLDPLLVANEGKLVAFVPEAYAEDALDALRAHPLGAEAARIGRVTAAHPGVVTVGNELGGDRVLDLPLHEPLPRIC